jgi:hypothetical protein
MLVTESVPFQLSFVPVEQSLTQACLYLSAAGPVSEQELQLVFASISSEKAIA